MKLIDNLISDVRNNDTGVRDVHVGYAWIGVLSGNCGVAKNLGALQGYNVRDLGKLTEKTAVELAEYAKSWNMIEAGVGFAAIRVVDAERMMKKKITEGGGKVSQFDDAIEFLVMER